VRLITLCAQSVGAGLFANKMAQRVWKSTALRANTQLLHRLGPQASSARYVPQIEQGVTNLAKNQDCFEGKNKFCLLI